ncbi:MAG: molecular chaperone HtpG, partial [Pseudomonadota bacterium]
MAQERLEFQAEVSRLLDIVARSLYSKKDVFLRELISNASDACDRLRYAALTTPDLLSDDAEFQIRLSVDKDAGTLTIADNGIGMDRTDLIKNLGTIARSGTGAFLDQINGSGGDDEKAKDDLALIGQFGVGFYSAFMVSDKVDVYTRKAGDAQGWHWSSDGKGSFEVGEAEGLKRGTRIVLHITDEAKEFLDQTRLEHIVRTHSDHVAVPVVMAGEDGADNRLNRAAALWTRSKSEITDEEYKEFYHHVGHGFDEPWATVHTKAEGTVEFTALLFVPSQPPFDLFTPDRRHHVRLYVRRVLVNEGAEGLVPPYLRFLRGVIDSEDLPLNISREMLQSNRMVGKIRQITTKRVLGDLAKRAKDDAEGYAQFWTSFGAVLKEGLYEEPDNREALLELARFRSTTVDGWTDLAGYVERMKEGQDAIYIITGENEQALERSPQLEGFKAKGVEVLLLTDPIDDFWTAAVETYKDKPFKSVTKGGADLSSIEKSEEKEDEKEPAADIADLVARLKIALGESVKDVRASERLTDSPVCLVADDGDMDMRMERLLR